MSKSGFANVALLAILIAIGAVKARADTVSGEDIAFFENKIRPVLIRHCYECHSAESEQVGGGLRLDHQEGVRNGGQSGPVLVAGKPEHSLLMDALRYEQLEMPPDQPLSAQVVRDFERWIRRGAVDPRRGATPAANDKSPSAEALWSFLPRRNPPVPSASDESWASDPLDNFVLASIDAADLTPTSDASSEVLIRRLHYDLLGLPPSREDVETFAKDFRLRGRRAVEELVDSLLHRPQFGERWGRHWLDVARFGESNGDDGLGRNATFPHAWRYRDYVIDSVNADIPYDQFLTEQIAGDLMPAHSAAQRNRQLVATGFLAIGAKPAAAMNKNFAMDVVDDQINVVCTTVLGLSVACARCHDHKHDPIPTRDYYALAGIFSSTETLYGLAGNEKLTAPPTALHSLSSVLPDDASATNDAQETPVFPDAFAMYIDSLSPQLHVALDEPPEELVVSKVKFSERDYASVESADIRGRFSSPARSYSVAFWFKNNTGNQTRPITAYLFSRAKLGDKALPGDHLGLGGKHDPTRAGKLFLFNGNDAKQSFAGTNVIAPGTWNHVVLTRDGERARVFLNGELEIECSLKVTFDDSNEFCLAARSDRFAPLVGNVAEFATFDRNLTAEEAQGMYRESRQPPRPRSLGLAMGVREKAKPTDCKIHVGGETSKLGAIVPRGFPTAYQEVPGESKFEFTNDYTIPPMESGRLQLAAWLTDPDHPQTARVIVNRTWLHLFGEGLVTTPDDFGVYGARPTHPDLLDHLAERMIHGKWSLKRLVRTIVLSRTYQLASRCDLKLITADPDNRLLARHNRRRLDAESLRDSLLKVSGRLDLRPGVGSDIDQTVALINWPPGEASNLHRKSQHRSVYLCLLRHAPPSELQPFDLPLGIRVVGQRSETTLPTQSLFLLNHPFVVEQSSWLAGRLLDVPSAEPSKIQAIYHHILQREPTDSEIDLAQKYVQDISATLTLTVRDPEQRTHQAWSSLCQALFASNEFRYID